MEPVEQLFNDDDETFSYWAALRLRNWCSPFEPVSVYSCFQHSSPNFVNCKFLEDFTIESIQDS